MQNRTIIVAVIALVVGLGAGYWFGNRQAGSAYDAGYAKALADAQATQDAAAKKAGEDAAKAANPFQASNPLEGVSANPFDQAKKVLNPFE